MGISLGPEVFQKKMHEMLEGLYGCDAVMNDILIWARNNEKHDRHLDKVLKRTCNCTCSSHVPIKF